MAVVTLTLVAVQMLAAASLPVFPVAGPPGVLAPGTQLRGVYALSSAPAPAPAPAQFVDERGPRGHFYYSDSCDDCVYKGSQCGCDASMEYFACLTKHCHDANHSKFAAKCTAVATNCSTEIDVMCAGPDSHCKAKYHQLPTGTIGLSLDLNGIQDDAFCGPHGKCTGTLHLKANIHNPPPQQMVPVLSWAFGQPVPAPAPAPAPGPGPAPGPAVAQPVFLECGIPAVEDLDIAKVWPDVGNQTHWTLCRAPLVGDKAACDLPMFPTLKASQTKEAYCVLTEGTEGNPPKRLTEPVWHSITNTHDSAAGRWHLLWCLVLPLMSLIRNE